MSSEIDNKCQKSWHYTGPDGAGDYHIREQGNGDCVAHTKSERVAAQIISEHNQSGSYFLIYYRWWSRTATTSEWIDENEVINSTLVDWLLASKEYDEIYKLVWAMPITKEEYELAKDELS